GGIPLSGVVSTNMIPNLPKSLFVASIASSIRACSTGALLSVRPSTATKTRPTGRLVPGATKTALVTAEPLTAPAAVTLRPLLVLEVEVLVVVVAAAALDVEQVSL